MTDVHKPVRARELATRRLSDDETVVLAPTGSAVILNEVGAVVLDLCDGTRTVDQIVAIVCDTLSGTTEERVRADVRSFVAKLFDSGCLVEAT
jgi:hypothetical protein